MKVGPHFKSNFLKLESVTERQWATTLEKCKRHIKYRIKQRTLFGAHSEKNLGEDPVHYYISYGYEAIISGDWEWKNRFNLTEQMIRIINSRISTEVEKMKTSKVEEFKISYQDIETDLYQVDIEKNDVNDEELKKLVNQVNMVELAIDGDVDLEFFWEGIKEGKKRNEIAELMDKKPKQLDKIKERFIRTIRNHNQSEKNNNES